ncbi:MAG: ABC transporter permease [Candidatus Sumerlaeia bacterium]|nr:ABC transporter permease [Candidatus Sumerlaeia bacterium]
MKAFVQNIFDNPILIRELRRRMRGRGLMYSIITYIIAMAISTSLIILIKTPNIGIESSVEVLTSMRQTGELIYYWITGIQFLLVLVLAPAITAGLTTMEKERKTFDFLRVTTITRWMYILGCFLSTTFYVILALVCALPLLSLSFLYGGVALMDVIRTFFLLLTCSCLLSAIGLFVSSIFDRTRTAQGVVIFLIFTLFFATLFLYSQFQLLFAGALAQGGEDGEGAMVANAIYILDYPVAPWVMICLSMMALAGLFLLLAARKLFEPEESRALNHWQFAVIYGVAVGGALLILSTNTFTNELAEIFFLTGIYTLLVMAVLTFAMGRMEVGDEIWHLKRLIPALRPFDQTIPFLLILGVAWWMTVEAIPKYAMVSHLEPAFLQTFLSVSLASFFFLCVAARAITAFSRTRRVAGFAIFSVISMMLFIIPVFATACWIALPGYSFILGEVVSLSPFILAIDGTFNMSRYEGSEPPFGSLATGMYIGLGIILAIIGETRRYRRWRGYDYHFDMPTG